MDSRLTFQVVEQPASSPLSGDLKGCADGSHTLRATRPVAQMHSRMQLLHGDGRTTVDVAATLEDGRLVSMPGAHPRWSGGFDIPVLVVGTDEVTRSTELEGTQFRVPGLKLARFEGSAQVFGHSLYVECEGERVEVTGPIQGVGWHEYLVRTRGAVELLVELWTGTQVDACDVQVRHAREWYRVLGAVQDIDRSGEALMPVGDICGEVLAAWIAEASRLGVVPWVARPSSDPALLEMGPMVVGAALEGYAGILGEKIVNPLSRSVRDRVKEAVRAALRQDGVADDQVTMVHDRVASSLGDFGRSFSSSVTPLVKVVDDLVPGLVQPDVGTWVKRLSGYRNAFAHMNPRPENDNLRLTEDNITALVAMAEVGRWVLHIVIVRHLLTIRYGEAVAAERLAAVLATHSKVQSLARDLAAGP